MRQRRGYGAMQPRGLGNERRYSVSGMFSLIREGPAFCRWLPLQLGLTIEICSHRILYCYGGWPTYIRALNFNVNFQKRFMRLNQMSLFCFVFFCVRPSRELASFSRTCSTSTFRFRMISNVVGDLKMCRCALIPVSWCSQRVALPQFRIAIHRVASGRFPNRPKFFAVCRMGSLRSRQLRIHSFCSTADMPASE